jgi:hypothetical protein
MYNLHCAIAAIRASSGTLGLESHELLLTFGEKVLLAAETETQGEGSLIRVFREPYEIKSILMKVNSYGHVSLLEKVQHSFLRFNQDAIAILAEITQLDQSEDIQRLVDHIPDAFYVAIERETGSSSSSARRAHSFARPGTTRVSDRRVPRNAEVAGVHDRDSGEGRRA